MARYMKTGLGLLLLCCTLAGAAAAQHGEDPAADAQAADLARQKQTVADLRNVGTALENDSWGHPYRFSLNADLLAPFVLGIRSAGRDASFDTDDYVIGPFPALEFDRDLVWIDGYFACWPEKPLGE